MTAEQEVIEARNAMRKSEIQDLRKYAQALRNDLPAMTDDHELVEAMKQLVRRLDRVIPDN